MSNWQWSQWGWLLGGLVLMSMWTIGQFIHDQRKVCACGCQKWDTWAECTTCHNCGRVL